MKSSLLPDSVGICGGTTKSPTNDQNRIRRHVMLHHHHVRCCSGKSSTNTPRRRHYCECVKECEVSTRRAILLPLQWVPVSSPTGRLPKSDRDRVRKHIANHNRSRLKFTKRMHLDESVRHKRDLAVRPKEDRSMKSNVREQILRRQVLFQEAPDGALQSPNSMKNFELSTIPNWWFPSNLQGPSNVPGLIFHLFEVLAPAMYEMNSQKENQHTSCLWRMGTFGPAAFFATLCSAATHVTRLQGRHISYQGVELKLRAIKQVNEILGDSKLALSDETIAAVIALAMHEHLFGSIKAWKAHMDGITQLVYLHGGIDSFGHNAILQTMLSWADVNAACVLGYPPRFALPNGASLLFPPSREDDSPLLILLKDQVNVHLLKTIWDFQVLISRLRSSASSIGPLLEGKWFSTKAQVTSIFHRLLSPLVTQDHEESSKVDEVCRLAILIHLCSLYGEFQKFPAIRNPEDVVRLRRELVATSTDWSGNLIHLELWILFTGACACIQATDLDWYMGRIRQRLDTLELYRWTDVQAVLKGFLWSGENCARRFFDVWETTVLQLPVDLDVRADIDPYLICREPIVRGSSGLLL